ncbi:hypothetical protein GH714_015304 [Hevea brasiliensis]|uniref:Uncharacterized protein n=1 Tax=Hevea brasiliensis TaxID=3981 RepID=A0A6A6LCD2_HEVBR|nr:hypothetical protein GH714_015304 [Hevea brasiliensis]
MQLLQNKQHMMQNTFQQSQAHSEANTQLAANVTKHSPEQTIASVCKTMCHSLKPTLGVMESEQKDHHPTSRCFDAKEKLFGEKEASLSFSKSETRHIPSGSNSQSDFYSLDEIPSLFHDYLASIGIHNVNSERLFTRFSYLAPYLREAAFNVLQSWKRDVKSMGDKEEFLMRALNVGLQEELFHSSPKEDETPTGHLDSPPIENPQFQTTGRG